MMAGPSDISAFILEAYARPAPISNPRDVIAGSRHRLWTRVKP
jgi:hypothetical protein